MNRMIWAQLGQGNNLNRPLIPASVTCVQDGYGTLYLNLKDVAIVLGFTRPKQGDSNKTPQYIRWDRLKKYLSQIINQKIQEELDAFTFITEQEYYQLLFHAETEQAIKLRAIVIQEFQKRVSIKEKFRIIAQALSAVE